MRETTDLHRGSSTARGYDRHWRALRDRKLAVHPLCECEDCNLLDIPLPADVVDHIQSIADHPELRLVWSNLRSMHHDCHNRHTARTQGFGRSRRSK